MENWRDKSGNSSTTAVWKDKKSKYSKSVNWRNKDENKGQNYNKSENNFRRNHNDATHAVASSDKNNLFESDKNQYECAGPKTLENVLKISDDAKLISVLTSETNGFLSMLDQPNVHSESDSMCLILDALARASETSSEQDTVQLLGLFYLKIIPKLNRNANFHCELKLYIADLGKHLAEQSPQRHKHIEAVQNLLTFLRQLQLTIRHKSFDIVRDFTQLITAQIEFINRKGNSLNDYIVGLLAQLTESVEQSQRMRVEAEKIQVLSEPPQNFRKISIYPDVFDILGDHAPFIRENVVEGKYVAGVDHYLDVQFRLLREDFVRPLRNGISEYVQIKNKPEAMAASKYRIKDLNVYKNVQIIGSEMLHYEQVHSCLFDCTPFRNVRWQYNKRMMSGSLVCLSPDDFKTFFFGTVVGQRDSAKLAKGEFQIKLEIERSTMPEITPLVTFVMVESHVYFEAYRHNLKVLQKFGEGNFPLSKYIVDVNKDISPPSYLANGTVYEISNGLPESDPEAETFSVDVLNKDEWPPREEFHLDESQYEAFRAALTKQMVVIQGPPGTGKTYIGMRIVETLLANCSEWPILIVCYTNHALDQFLEGIMKYCDENELIRIGSKSQCEALQRFNLATIKSAMRSSYHQGKLNLIREARYSCNNELKSLQEQISLAEIRINGVRDSVLGCELENVIKECNPKHYFQLQSGANGRQFNEGILNWLGYAVNKQQGTHQDNIAAGTGNDHTLVMPQEFYEEAEMDEEEIKEMERERIIEDSSDEEDDSYSYTSPKYVVTRSMPFIRQTDEPIDLDKIVPIDVDSDGFTTVQNKHRSIKREFKYEINRPQTMSKQEAATVANITSLPPKQRWNLYRLWLQLYMKNLEKLIKAYRAEYRNECFEFNDLRQQEDVEIVKRAKIIGMTTTGAAKYRHIIDGTKPKITIVEEAAEVLEAHIVTALCKEADHLILIGDHLQLRPNPAVFELAKKFNLEISLFERLIKNEMEYHQLKQQHRMRPCISSLLVPHIYKQLLDHPSVEQYEHVKGISKDMFFINHDQNESSMHDTSSHINSHEASFVVELCRYLILQGYETSKVTILTTYSGQLHQIRQLMRGQQLLSGVRAAVVDNYQGEENDIILLSFVRSNEEGNIGFLKTSNRINVALSRARKGLYCIGNFDCFQNETKLWKNLMAYLAEQSAFGEALTVYCQNHPENKTSVKSKEDFTSLVPEGGCTLACNSRLPCGHSCTKRCHFIDAEHTDYYQLCPSRCNRIICERDHRCPKICHHGEECGNCAVLIEKLRLECQHMVRVSCSGNPSLVFCKVPCERNRSCGHKCMGTCGAACDKTTCNEVVEVGSPCGHNVTIICSDSKNDMKLLIACSEPCNFELKCGHLCKGSCAQCHYGRLHISCEEQCTRTLICGHPCPDSCSTECAPCKKKCPNSCVHAKCPSLCGYPCIPCKEKCAQRCDHSQCSKLCSEPCDRELCKHPNTKTLAKCGHPSIGVCGEKMPSLCRVCDKDDEIFSGKEENARFIELEDCKHTIEVNELIHWLTSEPDSAALNSDGNRARDVGLKKCPKCETVIRHTKSLNPFIQASLGDIEQVKSKMCGDPKQNQTTQRKLNEKVKGIVGRELFRTETISLRNLYADIYGETESGKRNVVRPKQTLIALTNKFELVETLKQICSTFEKRIKSRQSKIQPGNIEKFVQRIRMVATFIKDFKNGEQQRKDISSEISFLQLMGDAIVKICAKPFIDFSDKLLNDAFEVANKYGGATENTRKEFSNLVVEAFEKPWRLEVSLVEKRTVLRFIGFQCGYWLKCPIGHIYCIGECDGVMEHSDVYKKCPSKCGRIICERNHPCPNICHIGSECEECIVKVPKLRTECQHTVQVSCSGNPSLVHCTSPCERKRSCGHRCKTICGTACDDSTCTEMVRAKSPCGHTVTIKCSDATNDAILLDACSEPCNVKLKCGHLCKGSCVRCQYGRLHISCAEKCIRKLICGHSCPEICSNDCPPCKKKCTNSCAHVKCRLRCGEPCQPCKEKCTWRCDHLQCSKLCSEPCDRELCTHPSTQTLDKCGHSSIGVCGEKIPSLCRVCDKDNKVFHGKGEDARFIELEDCKHIFEVSALMKWLEAEPDGKNRNRIQLRKCPQCHFVIRRSQSLNTFIRGSLRDIEQVKLKTRGEPESNKAIQSDLTRKCYEILGKLLKFRMVKLDSIFMNIYTKARVACVGPSPRQTLIMLSNKFKLADALRKICLTYEDRTMSNQNVSSKSLENFEHRIRMVSAFFVGFNNSEQQRDDISTEMLFLQLVGDVIVKASAQSFNETEKKSLDDAFQLANASVRATETVRTDFLRFVNEAFANSPGLGISFNEKQLILEAISLRRGHWYKCPNGHIYCIGECGATERNKCPECGTVIDGALKILEPSDASATEMEDAPAAVNPPAVKGTITPI